ncbi:MAG: hypothetical protein Q9191_000380 [Dirinaria sp. TL-2023a]
MSTRIESAVAIAAPDSSPSPYSNLLLTYPSPGVAQITLHRPRALNALSSALIHDLNTCLSDLFASPRTVRAIVLTGSPRAFCAGADVRELLNLTAEEITNSDFPAEWSRVLFTCTQRRCPIIAAVNGIAFGGGCELALMADVLYCSAEARFALPEVRLGLIPGAGGTQRLAKAVGKARAMEMVLTGREVGGVLAGQWGIASKVLDHADECVDEAVKTAALIAGLSPGAVRAAREVVECSQEVGLREGVKLERGVFQDLCASVNGQIGLKAFVERKEAKWVEE